MNTRTYKNCKLLIENNRYEYDDMYNKLDLFLMMNRITDDEYVELTGMLVEPLPEPEPIEPEPTPEPEPEPTPEPAPDPEPETPVDPEPEAPVVE
ncbi:MULTISPECIES: hypothetical protein [Blautia]|uniref:hypothetical protein n=1 Tax=Blautia TaxID=572511 RepID=UPI000BA31F79|nr:MULTISPECIES: hypothetical protein [Blautia]